MSENWAAKITTSKYSGPKLRKAKLFNVYDCARLAGPKQVYISYHRADHGRGGMWAHFSVSGVGFKTDPTAHWQHNGSKCFSGTIKDGEVFREAIAWCRERYGFDSWVKIHGNDWITAEAYKAVESHMRNAISKATEEA